MFYRSVGEKCEVISFRVCILKLKSALSSILLYLFQLFQYDFKNYVYKWLKICSVITKDQNQLKL